MHTITRITEFEGKVLLSLQEEVEKAHLAYLDKVAEYTGAHAAIREKNKDNAELKYNHNQVDTGYGFTCDEEILPFVMAIREKGFRTLGSCQCHNDITKERFVTFISEPHKLFDFVMHIKNKMYNGEFGGGWREEIIIQGFKDEPWAALNWQVKNDDKILETIKSYEEEK